MINMLDRVDAWLEDSGLASGWIYQVPFWNDTGAATDRFIVLQPNGGSAMSPELGNDYYYLIWVVGQQGQTDTKSVLDKCYEVMNYISSNPKDSCLGELRLQTPMPTPVLTEEKRVVCQVAFRLIFGE